MGRFTFDRSSRLLAIATLLSALAPMPGRAAPTGDGWPLEPRPGWVVPIEPFATVSAEPDGSTASIDYRLLDRQLDLRRAGSPLEWRAIERAFRTRDGVHHGSRLEIVFDPQYQRVRLHELEIRRGGRVEDRRGSARIDLLHREPDLEAATFDGRRTLSIVLADVRVGDVLRASWSIEGVNPVFDGHFEAGFRTTLDHAWQARRRLRVLSAASRPLHVRQQGPAIEPERVVESDVETLTVDLVGLVPRHADGDEPRGAEGLIVFGTLEGWGEIVALEAPLYEPPVTRPAELTEIAGRIRAAHADPRERIGAALRWVQEEIRYFGVQLGQHSHRPAPVSETLARRFADCKGVALLLITLLDELGIASSPALVEVDGLHLDPDQPWRLHAFDHVVVALELDGQRHFVDPTYGDQRGPLGRFHEPDHHRALVLEVGVDALEPMGGARSGWYVEVENALVIPAERDAATTFTVTTRRRGRAAERERRELGREGVRALAAGWLEYYENRWPGIVELAPVEIEDGDGVLSVTERYAIPAFWGDGDDPVRLVPDTLSSDWLSLPGPDEDRPALPTVLSWPAEVTERWRIELPEPMRLDGLGGEIVTPWYRVEETWSLDESATSLDVVQRYVGLADRVEAARRDEFESRREDMESLLAFSVEDARPLPSWLRSALDELDEASEPRPPTARESAEGWAVLVGFPGIALWGWLRHRRNRRRVAKERTEATAA